MIPVTSSRHLHRLWLLLGLAGPALLGADSNPIETIGKAATDWVKVRSETVRLESDWDSQRQILTSTVGALQQRAADLESKRDNLKAKTAKERDELETLAAKNTTASDGLKTLETRLDKMKEALIRLRPSLPPRLSEALELPYRSLATPDLEPGARMQLAMTILNRCVQFNRLITSSEEVLTIEGEPAPRSLEVIYWGLSQGYALDRAGGKVWLGSPGPQGWHWEARPDAVKQVTRLIAVYDGKRDPELVAVPARLGHLNAESPTN